MKRTIYATLTAAIALAAASCAGLRGTGVQPTGVTPDSYAAATVTRDRWGVPYVAAPDDAAAAFALAWAMAEDGFAELEDGYARALGRSAAYYGERDVASDALRMSAGGEVQARAEFAQLALAETGPWRGFADGLNHFLRMHPQVQPRHFAKFEAWMPYAFARDVAIVQPLHRWLLDGVEADAFVASPAVGADGAVLFASGRSSPNAYEMHTEIAGRSFHGFTELGLAIPMEGFNATVAFAPRPQPSDSLVRRVTASSAAVRAATDSIRVNTSTGVLVRAATRQSIEDRPVVGLRGDTMLVLRSAPAAAVVLRQWIAMSRAETAADADAAATVSGGAHLLYSHVSGAGNVTAVAAEPTARERVARAMLHSTRAWSIARMADVAFDTRVGSADGKIAALVDEWEQVGARNPERAGALDSAVAMLRAWDRRSAVESAAMSLYAAWFDRVALMQTEGELARFLALEWVIADPRRYPPPAWGSTNAVSRSPLVAGERTAGAPARLGIMFAYDIDDRAQRWVWVADLSRGSASSVLSYGQSPAAGSPHRMDQAPLFAAASLKLVVASAAAVGGSPFQPFTSR